MTAPHLRKNDLESFANVQTIGGPHAFPDERHSTGGIES
jgi:hypothetical protein